MDNEYNTLTLSTILPTYSSAKERAFKLSNQPLIDLDTRFPVIETVNDKRKPGQHNYLEKTTLNKKVA